MKLDVPTIIVTQLGSAVLSGLVLVASPAARGTPGMRQAITAVWTLAIGLLCQVLRGLVPDVVPIVLGNVALWLGTAAMVDGYRRFDDPTRRSPGVYAFVAASSVAFCVAWLAGASYVARALCVSGIVAINLVLGISALARRDRMVDEPSRRIVIGLNAATLTMQLVRCAVLLLDPTTDPNPLHPSLERTLAFLPSMLAVQSFGLGFLLLQRDRSEAEARRVATTDALTGCLNRRALDERVRGELDYARRRRIGCGVVVLDLDHFKKINDTLGHAAGDAVLLHVGQVLRNAVRSSDLVARYGGEEFCVLLRDADPERAAMLAGRLLLALRSSDLHVNGKAIATTASIGVACFDPDAPEPWDVLFHLADEAMYRAKRAGRNRVERALSSTSSPSTPSPSTEGSSVGASSSSAAA